MPRAKDQQQTVNSETKTNGLETISLLAVLAESNTEIEFGNCWILFKYPVDYFLFVINMKQ